MSDSVASRVQKIEEHVNEKLKKDLKFVIDAGDQIYAQISEYLELKNLIVKIKDVAVKDEPLKTRVNIGCNIYVKAIIPSYERILVDIGLGFYLECSHDEALQIIEERISLLRDRVTTYKKASISIKAQIKLFLEGLRNLQGIQV